MHSSVINSNLGAGLAGLGAGVAFVLLIGIFAILIMCILAYIFSSMAFYRFMKSRNIENAFLAWIPVVAAYTVGKVYDDINEERGKHTNFGIILLILSCSRSFLWVLLVTPLALTYFLPGFEWGLSIAILVLTLICYNLIFKKYAPNKPSYFVLSVIFSIVPIIPFIPGLCLLKASHNQPVSQIESN